MATTPLEMGDTVTLTVTGKVVDPQLGGSHAATTVKVNRPGEWSYKDNARVDGVTVDIVLDPAAEVKVDIKSRYKNGVWRDESGVYWMRRPDGWHKMPIETEPTKGQLGRPFTPPAVSRLAEDKDSK